MPTMTSNETFTRTPFAQFQRELVWRQGEHVLLAAPTQCGKSTLASILAARRKNVVVLANKAKDDNLKARYADYYRTTEWPAPRDEARVILWPKRPKTLAEVKIVQRAQMKACLDDIGRSGGWCVVVDEAHWTSQQLRLDQEIAILHHQGSSMGVSMMVLTQRPAWIPRIIYSSATHIFLGKTSARDDLRVLANLGGIDAKQVLETLQTLGRHDLLYLNPMGDSEPTIINIRK